MSTLEALLKQAIARDGRNPTRLARDAGVDQSTVHRFVVGESGLTLATAEKLLVALGLKAKFVTRKGTRR